MLRKTNPQLTLWESILPECCLGLPGDLAETDELLDDDRFFEPFRPFFDPVMGRPSIPIETPLPWRALQISLNHFIKNQKRQAHGYRTWAGFRGQNPVGLRGGSRPRHRRDQAFTIRASRSGSQLGSTLVRVDSKKSNKAASSGKAGTGCLLGPRLRLGV